jgi:diguanylate cyclase (GGDEF)-like protein
MRWSLRKSLLAIVLPLTLTTLVLSAVRIADLLTVRDDIAAFRDSAFRSIYAERYARYLQELLKVSFGYLAGTGDGLHEVAAARDRAFETLESLRPFVHARAADAGIPELTSDTLDGWQQTQEQVDIYIGRAVSLARSGEGVRARRLLMDDLEVLLRSRVLPELDLMAQRDRELLEEYRVRIMRPTEHWLASGGDVVDLRARLLPDIYEVILAERFARDAVADVKAFTHYVVMGGSLDPSHGVAAGQAIARLSQLQGRRAGPGGSVRPAKAGDPAATYALAREVYAGTLALPEASRRSHGRSVLGNLDAIVEQSLLPQIDALVGAHEHEIEREMRRLDRFAQVILSLAIGIATLAIVFGLVSPVLAIRIFVRPVVDLVGTVTRFREGKKDARPRVRPRNELGLLSGALRDLLDDMEKTEKNMRSLALYDSTTGLPNRKFFLERLSGAVVTARIQGRAMGLLSVHLVGVKEVNETYGHDAGDALIRQVAARLRDSLRLSDIVSHPSEREWKSVVSHVGGDEFTVLLTKVREPADSAIAAQRILSKMAEPFEVDGREVLVTASIGIGVYPQDGGDAETILRNSCAAMNHVQKMGGNLYQFCTEALNTANTRKLHIQSRLSGAIERGDLELHYQPIRHAVNGELTAAEALLRWVDAEMGPIGPDEFIPIAENGGMIGKIGAWVLSEACKQARAWQDAGHPSIRISVNVSANQLRDERWVKTVAETILETGLSPGCLELELTETTIIQDDPVTITMLTQLSDLGVGIVLDDFGTGFSSLSHLRRLPISRVKIDRSFVSEISEEGDGAALVAAIVTLAHSLRLEVVAEGVETEEQVVFLRQSHCDELQGYLISGAVPPAEFEHILTAAKPE